MHNSKPTCLICKEKVSVVKEYNVRRHYETKHSEYAKFSKELKTRKLDSLKSELRNQQRLLNSSIHSSSDTVKASYSVAMIISKRMKSFSDGEFVKECLDAVVKDILPDKTKKFSNISLSRQTICRRVNDISNEIVVTLRDQIKYFKSYSLAFDECTDISDTSQLVVYIRGVTESFQVKQEMLNLVSLKDTTKGEDIFQAVMKCLSDNGANLETLAGLTTDGAPAMIGRNKGVTEIIDLQCNSELRLVYPTISKIDFYNKYVTAEKYPNLRIFAQRVVSSFGSTYVCESFFSKLKFSKSRYRSSLTDKNLENQLRCATNVNNLAAIYNPADTSDPRGCAAFALGVQHKRALIQ
ncbi:general transcription factor II-I repeat domain-containing protein 2A-like [Octopus sinensis]|uniref:General transcription factor II-I repeat domain-containing protein 2A-like n=1 Tax=Octopus sinensis TaxID=2607531 RepID=A0A6P7TWS1_9MOLL|nr:general transcription factor II-I repeat domain-containing protein 2A-like [Octopus sinensis]